MYILAFDTCFGACSVAVADASGLLAYRQEDAVNMQSRYLLEMVGLCLKEAGNLPHTQISKVFVTNGPGSFTGTRVGLAAAVGLKAALDIEVYSASTLDVVAQACKKHPEKYLAQLEAGRGMFYQQFFQAGMAQGPIMHHNMQAAALIREQENNLLVVGNGPSTGEKQMPEAKLLLQANVCLNKTFEAIYSAR